MFYFKKEEMLLAAGKSKTYFFYKSFLIFGGLGTELGRNPIAHPVFQFLTICGTDDKS